MVLLCNGVTAAEAVNNNPPQVIIIMLDFSIPFSFLAACFMIQKDKSIPRKKIFRIFY